MTLLRAGFVGAAVFFGTLALALGMQWVAAAMGWVR
jgi:hypothetical protein